jgi:hypothetical protein
VAVCLRLLLVPLAAACTGLSGCAGFWDEVTSRDFHFKEMFQRPPDPLTVVRTSTDGDKKSKALRALREPLQNGGTPQQQEEVVHALVWSATSDPQALCRLAAINVLQDFTDPRAADALKEAYYRASSFDPGTATTIKCLALAALGENGNPAAVELLVRVLQEPTLEGADVEKQQKLDERIAAARALSHFPQYQAAEALVGVLRTEQDAALRDRAQESLVQLTGEDLPPDAQAWTDFLHQPGNKDVLGKKPSLTDKILRLMSSPPRSASPATDKPEAPAPKP